MFIKNKSNLVFFLSIIASAIFWCLDAIIDALFFEEDSTIFESIFLPENHEIYMRGIVLLLFIIVAFITRKLLVQQEAISQELEKHKHNLEGIVHERTEELEKLATIDDLTQIYNRRKFFDLAQSEIDRSTRYQNPLSVIMIDIDHFKDINDQHGHHIGDQTLRLFSKTILSLIRNTDVFGRLGGEEFALILPETPKQAAKEFAERIRQCIANEKFPNIEHMTICLGITQLYADDSSNAIFNRADIALYAAKNDGRNKVVSA